MGGNVFLVPAKRLSMTELLLFLKHVKTQLAPYFSGIEITRFFEEKTSHGDLDVLCALWMEGEGWKGGDQDGVLTPDDSDDSHGSKKSKEEDECGRDFINRLGKVREIEWSREDVRVFADLLAWKLRATKWKKHGWEISFAIPCTVLGSNAESAGPDDFYQLDLLLIKPPSLRFSIMTSSYGISALLLSSVLRRMSSSFTIHADRFVMRYSPYHGLIAIEVDLTDKPEEFMEWAGLDPERFEKGFKTERDFWRWLACLPDNIEEMSIEEQVGQKEVVFAKRFAQGWKRMARQKSGQQDNVKMPKGHSKARLEVMARFRDYIKSTIYADTPIFTGIGTGDTSTDGITSAVSQLELGSSPVEKVQPTLDPGNPRLLSDRAKEALEHFGETETWRSILDERRIEAEGLVSRQRRGRPVLAPTQSNTMATTSSTVTTTQTGHGLVIVHEKIQEMIAEPKAL